MHRRATWRCAEWDAKRGHARRHFSSRSGDSGALVRVRNSRNVSQVVALAYTLPTRLLLVTCVFLAFGWNALAQTPSQRAAIRTIEVATSASM